MPRPDVLFLCFLCFFFIKKRLFYMSMDPLGCHPAEAWDNFPGRPPPSVTAGQHASIQCKCFSMHMDRNNKKKKAIKAFKAGLWRSSVSVYIMISVAWIPNKYYTYISTFVMNEHRKQKTVTERGGGGSQVRQQMQILILYQNEWMNTLKWK